MPPRMVVVQSRLNGGNRSFRSAIHRLGVWVLLEDLAVYFFGVGTSSSFVVMLGPPRPLRWGGAAYAR